MEQVITERFGAGQTIYSPETTDANEANASGISWAAVIGGGVVTAALSLVLLALGTGLGLSSVSVWSNVGLSSSTVGTVTIVWLVAMQVISSSMGGYLAGRLRTKWTAIHTDEVYFRDTAHGFLSWALAFVLTVGFLATAATTMVGVGASTYGQTAPRATDSNQYFIDSLFRGGNAGPEVNGAASRSEAGTIFSMSLKDGSLTAQDRAYLGQLVAAKTGLSPAESENRASEIFARTQQAAETTRKAVAHSLLWAFVALLIGAFCSSFAATVGGRQRDHIVLA